MLNNLIENWRADPEQPGGESEQMDDILVEFMFSERVSMTRLNYENDIFC